MRQEKKQACFLVPYKHFHSFFTLYVGMPSEEVDDAGFTLEEELRREMLDCLDSLSQEIQQVSAYVVDL